MLRLSTFGGLVLHQDGQLHTGPAAQRRRLALLAVIAAAGRRGVGRDRLLALLWPDSEPEAARHSLYQALHALRRALGGDDVFLGSSTLQLNPERITSDVGELHDAVEESAHERVEMGLDCLYFNGVQLDAGESETLEITAFPAAAS